MFEIISAADGDFLVEVLNGVAMLVGGGNFRGMMMLGMVIGLLIVGARALLTQRLELQWVLIGWLMYAVMFVPTVTVTVEDLATGNTNPVDNVPIGVAAIGTVTSQLGLGMAEAFQTVFAPPGTPGSGPITGYADSLNILAAMREPGYGDANDAAAGAAVNVDMQRTVSRYLRDCVLYAIAVEDSPLSLTWERLRTSPNLLEDIRVDAVSWWTVTYLDPADADGTPQTCQAAYAAIAGQLNGGGFQTEWFEYLGAKLGVDNAQAEVQDAMDHLFGVGGNAQQFMRNALLAKELQLADLDYQAAVGNSAGVIMRTQAIEQRRVQWAAEKTLFEEMARPLMGYIEGFFYAVSPIMAFVFVLGQFGVMLFGRYLLLAAWIQLWMPIMAINNLYINRAAERSLEELSAGGMDLMSMTGLDSVWTEAASWIAVGGMMAAATPLLALMLLTGSYFAMTQLTNRMAGRDFTNEKTMAPDLMQPAPVASLGAQFSQEAHWLTGHVYGTRRPGAEGVAPQIEWDMERRAAVTETHAAMAAHSHQFQAMRSEAVNNTLSSQQGWERAMSTLETNQGSFTSMDQAMWNQASSIANRHVNMSALSETEQSSVTRTLSLGIQAGGLDLLPVSMRGELENKIQKANQVEEREASEIAEAISTQVSSTDSSAASYQRAIAASDGSVEKSVFAQALGMTESQGFSKMANDLQQSSHTVSEMDMQMGEIGVEQSMSAVAFGERFMAHKVALEATAIEAGVSEGAIDRLAGEMLNYYGVEDPDQARTAALGVLLTQHDPGAAFGAIAVSQGAMAGRLDFGHEIATQPAGTARPEWADDVGTDATAQDVQRSVAAGRAGVEAAVEAGRAEPQTFYEASRQAVDEVAAEQAELHQQQATANKTQQLLDEYAPVQAPAHHPALADKHLQAMVMDFDYRAPKQGTRSGDRTIAGHAETAAASGITGRLQQYYAGRAAEEQDGMVLAEGAYPSREELLEQYQHGEQVLGYIDNAVNSMEGASLTETGPSDYLEAAAYLVENPLQSHGGAGKPFGHTTKTSPPAGRSAAGGETPSNPAAQPEVAAKPLGTGATAAAETASKVGGEAASGGAPSLAPGGEALETGLGDSERATVAESLGTGTPGRAAADSQPPARAAATAATASNPGGDAPSGDPPSAAPGGGAPAAGLSDRERDTIAESVGMKTPEAPATAPPADAPSAASGEAATAGPGAGAESRTEAVKTAAPRGDEPAGTGLSGTGALAPGGSAQPESAAPAAAETVGGIAAEAARSGGGADTPSTGGVPSRDSAVAPKGESDGTPVAFVQAPAAQATPSSPDALAEQLYEANISRGVPENTAWVVAQQAAGAGTAGPEYDRHMEGMQRELAAEPKAMAAVQGAIDDYAQGFTSSYENHMDDLATHYRDAQARATQ